MKSIKKIMGFAVFIISISLTANAAARPNFSLPFPCNQTWSGQTRTNHSPRPSIDFNRAYDYGDTVVASAKGRVITVRNLGSRSYGKYIVIDHGSGWTSYYAHLASFNVNVGQYVRKGQKIGAVGNTGGSTGAHLHYEQRYNGGYASIYFEGSKAYYYGTRSYKSKNSCATTAAYGTVRTSGWNLNARSGPSTSYRVVDSLPNGTRVRVYCHKKGQTISGTYGTTSLWDYIGNGRYVSDAYIYTGSDGRVAPWCN